MKNLKRLPDGSFLNPRTGQPLLIDEIEWIYWKDLPKDAQGKYQGDGYTITHAEPLPDQDKAPS